MHSATTGNHSLHDARLPSGLGGLWYGVYPALVTDVRDPDGQGRVKISLPWASDPDGAAYSGWARLATLLAGSRHGSWFIPDRGDEVLVSFAGGDVRHPFVLGGLWNGHDAPPQQMDGAGRNDLKVLRTRSGLTVTLDDRSGQERLQLDTPGGQRLILKDGPGSVEISDSNGNSVQLEAAGVTVTASAKVTVNATSVEVTAAVLTVNAALSTFHGVVQADTVITNAVVSASYTPGAGNIL